MSYAAKLRVIRSGRVIKQIEGQTPFQIELVDPEVPRGGGLNYRVEVVGQGGELLTNPIYVAPTNVSFSTSPQLKPLVSGASLRAGSQQPDRRGTACA